MEFTDAARLTVMSATSGPRGSFPDLPPPDARRVRKAWDEATARLTEAGLPATFDTVCAVVAAGDGPAARHARGLIARALGEGLR